MIVRLHRFVAITATFLLILTTVGCKSGKRFDVSVSLDAQSWARAYGSVLPSLEVDLIGINKSEKGTWDNYSVNKYFSPNDALRRDADRVTLTFTNDDRDTKVLSKKDPVWGRWIGTLFSKRNSKNAQWLFLIANIPGIAEDLPGDQDPRRVILPLALSAWPITTRRIEIDVKSSMLVSSTSPKAK